MKTLNIISFEFQFKMAIVVMGRQKYIPDDSNEVVRIEDFQPHSLHGMNTSGQCVLC